MMAWGQSCSASNFSAVASEARESSGLLPNEAAGEAVVIGVALACTTGGDGAAGGEGEVFNG
ncbi:MAG: hypothetical protein H0T83_04995 [Chthoniobacterales bacterium]|nr:hypothetical protein [Chthoniobacterales bacterium]